MNELSKIFSECDGCGEDRPFCVCDDKPDEFYEPPDFSCCLDDCVIPFPHFESEYCSAEMIENQEAK